MDARAAFAVANANPHPSFGRFYGQVGDAALGAGMVVANVEYPAFLKEEDRFAILRGTALILTHECDLDQGNDRVFNDAALVCPIIPLEDFVDALAAVTDEEEMKVFLGNVTGRYVNRIMYIPILPDTLPYGGYLYFNLIASTSMSRLAADETRKVSLLSVDGLREVDLALERHLRRPKADRLPFQQSFIMGR